MTKMMNWPVASADQVWRNQAACRGEDPELFFPVGTGIANGRQVTEAKAVCYRCPSASNCLAWALETGQDAGIWGGQTESERRAIKRRETRSRTRGDL